MKKSLLYAVGRVIGIPFFKLLFFYKVNGKENVPKTGPFVVCPNHLSNFDPILIALSQRRQVFFMSKSEMFENPLRAWLFRTLGAFPVKRGAGDGKAINAAENVVSEGELLGIFIEGTRSKTGELLRPRSGPALIAYEKNVPIIPVCITPKNKKIKLFQKVIISWGKPLAPEQLGFKNGGGEEYRNASRMVMSEIMKMRERDLGINNTNED